ncbi:MAG: hypothetical protein ACK5RJ_06455 [Burkholderiales bacterium]|jgi:hypothetical protein|nr:hypothetical protein [Rhodocyclaceae bacterium]MCA3023644.1 hypothetical protein [Rhodocyclaceae bacterium]MCA3053630.1 hypothetical protein [Rhodocyclaceae bacterium]MCA3055130.1 hypothetical protein [Rhodocyclaceae bacterium]
MSKKSLSKIAEAQPIRKHDIAVGRLVLRQRAKGGESQPANPLAGAAIKHLSTKY